MSKIPATGPGVCQNPSDWTANFQSLPVAVGLGCGLFAVGATGLAIPSHPGYGNPASKGSHPQRWRQGRDEALELAKEAR